MQPLPTPRCAHACTAKVLRRAEGAAATSCRAQYAHASLSYTHALVTKCHAAPRPAVAARNVTYRGSSLTVLALSNDEYVGGHILAAGTPFEVGAAAGVRVLLSVLCYQQVLLVLCKHEFVDRGHILAAGTPFEVGVARARQRRSLSYFPGTSRCPCLFDAQPPSRRVKSIDTLTFDQRCSTCSHRSGRWA